MAPITPEMMAAENPTAIEMRDPSRKPDSTSAPLPSVPSQCSELGGARISGWKSRVGSSGASHGAVSAISVKKIRMPRPARPVFDAHVFEATRFVAFHARSPAPCWRTVAASVAISSPSRADRDSRNTCPPRSSR